MEFCSQCGKEVDYLNEYTGWCKNCSPLHCLNCDKKISKGNLYCDKCKKLFWLEAHADEIEDLMMEGLSLTAAKRKIYDEKRPICLSCELPIPHARSSNKRPTKFCQRTAQCKAAKRRYKTLQEGALRLPPQIALEQTLREIGKL